MGKLHPLPQRKVIEILKNNGFQEVRSRKHITFKKKDKECKRQHGFRIIMKLLFLF